MQTTQIVGDASKNKAKNYGWDAKISSEIMQLPAGPLAITRLGVDYRKEELELINSAFCLPVTSGAARARSVLTGVDRTVSAFFGEVNIQS
jgi:hypothetical protein